MNRLVLACLVMVAICVLAVVVFVVVPRLSSPSINLSSDGRTNGTRLPSPSINLSSDDQAIGIALADPGVKTAIEDHNGNYQVVGVVPQDQNPDSGYFNFSNTLVMVNMTMLHALSPGVNVPERYLAFVDLNRSAVVDRESYSYRGSPGELSLTLPPGAYYYHILSGPYVSTGVQLFRFDVGKLSPENAAVYPIIVDEANLSQMKRGDGYEPAVYIDTSTNTPSTMNGTIPVHAMWFVNASVPRPPNIPSNAGNWPSYYIVLKNSGPDTAYMDIVTM
jgi:hypothetical protein